MYTLFYSALACTNLIYPPKCYYRSNDLPLSVSYLRFLVQSAAPQTVPDLEHVDVVFNLQTQKYGTTQQPNNSDPKEQCAINIGNF